MGITDTCHYLLKDVAEDNSRYVISRILLCSTQLWSTLLYPKSCSALLNFGMLYYNQLYFDKILLMKRCVLLFTVNNLFPYLNPRVNISLAGEVFILHFLHSFLWSDIWIHLPLLLFYCTHVNFSHAYLWGTISFLQTTPICKGKIAYNPNLLL